MSLDAVKARPILFSAPMVRALQEGRKTQTRRVIKPQFERAPVEVVDGTPSWDAPTNYDGEVQMNTVRGKQCPYGKPADLLWCREKFSTHVRIAEPYYLPQDYPDAALGCWYWADGSPDRGDWTRPKPSIHMPRWASRLTLRLTDVRVERLQEISEDDALAEGIDGPGPGVVLPGDFDQGRGNQPGYSVLGIGTFPTASSAYQVLWESLHGPGSWAANPWVWALSFSIIHANVDAVLREAA